MIGQDVRMVAAPNTRIGIIKAARFGREDPRLTYTLPDVWMRDFELEECKRPTDEQVTMINNLMIQDY